VVVQGFAPVLLVAVALSCAEAQDQPTVVPVPNADMEEGDQGPAHWRWGMNDGGQGSQAWETGWAHSGKRSFRMKKTNVDGYSFLLSDFLPVEPGKTYEVSAWVYTPQPARRGVYFMISQHRPDTGDQQLPNTFGRTDQPIPAGEWTRLSISVTIREGNTRMTIQALQAFVPLDISWDGFRVGPAEPAPKPRYEPPTAEPLPDLAPAKAIVAQRPRARARVEVREGRGRLVVDGKLAPWCFYVSPFWNPQDAQIADFRQAGVRVYLVPLVLGRGVYGDRGPWLAQGKYDFAEVDDLLWRVLGVDPEGYILFYMACDPYREWGAEHPEEVTWDQNGKKAIVDMHPKRWGEDPKPPERFGPSLVSKLLRDDTAACLRELVKHVEQSEPGKAVIGYHVAGSNDGQWFQWAKPDPADLHLADYSPGAARSFREWLSRQYGGKIEALRQAWHQPPVTFETAAIPAGDRRLGDGFLLDMAKDQDLADYTRFYSEGVAETVMFLASVIKQATPRPVICGTYYEDITCNSPNHIALGRYLASDALDFLAGPAAYGVRLPGNTGGVRNVFGSTVLHGKTYLTEQDWRSWHAGPDPDPANNEAWGRAESAAAHNAMVRRESGMMLAFGLGTWWYDMSGGWFRDDQIMAAIAEARRGFERDTTVPGLPRGDLAVFVSEETNAHLFPKLAASYRYLGILNQV